MRLGVDVMGGDNAPDEILKGCLQALPKLPQEDRLVLYGDRRVIGLEVAGFTQLLGEQWRLSTIENWEFVGETQPKDTIKDSLRKFCRQVFEVFSGESMKGGQ